MNIKIGEKIKSLRKKADVTQEKFADYLGITPQAISRWESGTAYPDIELIPAIANFFSVSSDELFGIDQAKNQEKINKIYDKIKDYSPKGLHDKKIKILREAIQEFPNDYGLLGSLAYALSYTNTNKEESRDEAIAIWERIIADAPGENHRALQALAFEYNSAGNKEKAIETAHKLPDINCTSSIILSRILEGEDRFKQLKNNIENFTDSLHMEYSMLAHSKYKDEPEKQIILLKKAIAVFEILCENKDYGFFNERLNSLNFSLCKIYLAQNNLDNALCHLEKSAHHAIQFDEAETFENNQKFEHSSIIFEREPSDTSVTSYSRTANFNSSYEMLQDLKNAKFDVLRGNNKFKEITAALEKYAKIYE